MSRRNSPESNREDKEVTEVWVFLHTRVEPLIIVGEETDELINQRERNGLTGEEG